MQKHSETNVFGFVWLFQATLPLLKKSTKDPKWVSMGSSAAFLTNMIDVPNASYAQTKVVVHWLTKRIHIEEPWLTAFPVDPGLVEKFPSGPYTGDLMTFANPDDTTWQLGPNGYR